MRRWALKNLPRCGLNKFKMCVLNRRLSPRHLLVHMIPARHPAGHPEKPTAIGHDLQRPSPRIRPNIPFLNRQFLGTETNHIVIIRSLPSRGSGFLAIARVLSPSPKKQKPGAPFGISGFVERCSAPFIFAKLTATRCRPSGRYPLHGLRRGLR